MTPGRPSLKPRFMKKRTTSCNFVLVSVHDSVRDSVADTDEDGFGVRDSVADTVEDGFGSLN